MNNIRFLNTKLSVKCTRCFMCVNIIPTGLLAKNAVAAGLSVAPYIKTSLSPGSGVVTYYLRESGVTSALKTLGFDTVGYGCMTCIGNSGPLPESVVNAIESVSPSWKNFTSLVNFVEKKILLKIPFGSRIRL